MPEVSPLQWVQRMYRSDKTGYRNKVVTRGAQQREQFDRLVVSDVLGVGLQVLDFTMSYMPTSVPYVPFPTPSPPQPPTISVAPGSGSIPSPNSAIMTSMDLDDPINKAVMDNVLGRLPTKKPKVAVRCDVCNLEFFSQAVLDSHLVGSKHQRKVKSADLMKTLEETEKGFERDEVSGVIRCIVCDVTVNSPQLLATHIAGNKHKQRASKRSGDCSSAPPAKRACPGVTGMETAPIRSSNGGPQAPNSADSSSNLDIPECVTKLEETKGGGKYLCNPCQAHCNSEQQLAQHLSSRKHQDKLSGRKPQGGGGWRGRRRPSFRGRPGGRGRPSHTYTQPLSSNFVAGGALL
ncbi:zinc finger protein 385B-like isoform X3 [Eriocheir sinensis]|uniref:zinc finger protein 385B-like isoform X3 n=1 Tax=Eriocheir sinensis TaxID=95602 RepID=UPI0021C623CD|nr:zinc finger protein 385B-like isoform X3 [Eriocheir sinensis]